MSDSTVKTVKLPKLDEGGKNFQVWKRLFKAYAKTGKYSVALREGAETTPEQQGNLYSALYLAVDESDIYLFEHIDEENENCGTLAWCALLDNYENDGVHRINDLKREFNRDQLPSENCIQYLNHLVSIRTQLISCGESVPETAVAIQVVAGLREEYATITDTMDQYDDSLTIANVRRTLSQSGVRIERRRAQRESAAAAFTAAQNAAVSAEAFAAATARISQLEAQLEAQRLPAGGPASRGRRVTRGQMRPFKGKCFNCNRYAGHKAADCPEGHGGRNRHSANTASTTPVAFPAAVLRLRGGCGRKSDDNEEQGAPSDPGSSPSRPLKNLRICNCEPDQHGGKKACICKPADSSSDNDNISESSITTSSDGFEIIPAGETDLENCSNNGTTSSDGFDIETAEPQAPSAHPAIYRVEIYAPGLHDPEEIRRIQEACDEALRRFQNCVCTASSTDSPFPTDKGRGVAPPPSPPSPPPPPKITHRPDDLDIPSTSTGGPWMHEDFCDQCGWILCARSQPLHTHETNCSTLTTVVALRDRILRFCPSQADDVTDLLMQWFHFDWAALENLMDDETLLMDCLTGCLDVLSLPTPVEMANAAQRSDAAVDMAAEQMDSLLEDQGLPVPAGKPIPADSETEVHVTPLRHHGRSLKQKRRQKREGRKARKAARHAGIRAAMRCLEEALAAFRSLDSDSGSDADASPSHGPSRCSLARRGLRKHSPPKTSRRRTRASRCSPHRNSRKSHQQPADAWLTRRPDLGGLVSKALPRWTATVPDSDMLRIYSVGRDAEEVATPSREPLPPDAYTAFAASSASAAQLPSHSWLVDSGASDHMTSCREDFSIYQALHPPRHVAGIDAVAEGVGSVELLVQDCRGRVVPATLSDVLFVPLLAARSGRPVYRLFSVATASDRGHSVCFAPEGDRLVLHGRSVSASHIPLDRQAGLPWLPAYFPSRSAHPSQAGKPSPVDKRLLHARLGHLGERGMEQLLKAGTIRYDPSDPLGFCDTCAVCKSRVQAIPRSPAARPPEDPFASVCVDLYGKFSTPSLGGCHYSFAAVCGNTNYILHDLLRTKDEASAAWSRFLGQVLSFGFRVRRVRVDNDSVLLGRPFRAICEAQGIVIERSAPYAHWQLGRIERQWGTLGDMARSMLYAAGLSDAYWGLAMKCAVYIRNRVWSSGAEGIPFLLVTGRSPDLSRLRVFGCPAYVHVDKNSRQKLSHRAWRGVFVGYADDSVAWLVYNPNTRRVIASRNVVFDELVSPGRVVGEGADAEDDDPGEPAFYPTPDQEPSNPDLAAPESNEPLRRSARERAPPSEWWKGDGKSAHPASATVYTPLNYSQALKCEESDKWLEAIQSEYDSLIKNRTWILVKAPKGANVMGSTWKFKVKTDKNGQVVRYKARLCARGDTQKAGIDYNEVFAPVVRYASIRILLAIAAIFDLEVEQLDVETAFLNSNLKETIHMRAPQGFREIDDEGNELVCRLLRGLYGLRQAPREWNATITDWLATKGFVQSMIDPGIYVHKSGANVYILALYVDDSILVGPAGPFIVEFKREFGKRFNIQDLGAVSWLLGMSVIRDRENRTLHLSQEQYVLDMLELFNMTDCKPAGTPLESKEIAGDDSPLPDSTPYKSLIGKLLYASSCTRPDITMAVSHLSRFMAKPQVKHWDQAKRILRYLKGTAHYGLTYGAAGSVTPEFFQDASYADEEGALSRTGLVAMLGGAAVNWGSQRQQTVALSTVEAEYMALTAATQDALFVRQLLEEIGHHQVEPSIMYEDNQGCISLSSNMMTTKRSKHINVRYHFCREKIASGDIKVIYCPTERMLADVLTKPLPMERHHKLIKIILGPPLH